MSLNNNEIEQINNCSLNASNWGCFAHGQTELAYSCPYVTSVQAEKPTINMQNC